MIPLSFRLRCKLFLLGLAIGISTIGLSCSVRAADIKMATGEDVAIAFFKTADTTPNFDGWVKNNPDYMVVPPDSVVAYIKKEKQRLLRRWKNYDASEDMLNIRVPIVANLESAPDEAGNQQYTLHLDFYDKDVTYFPYIFGEYKFAVMPLKLKTMFHQPLSKEQYDTIKRDLSRDNAALLFLALKPVKAHTDQPYDIDGVEQWVLKTDIASMTLKTKNGRTDLWNYNAQWYIPPETGKVLDLYKHP